MVVYLAGVRVLAILVASALCVAGILATAPTLVPATAPTGPGGGPPLALTGYDPHGDHQTRNPFPQGPDPATGRSTPKPDRSDVASGLTGSGIPYVALRAYKAAARSLGRTEPACGLDWALLAAIGRVESDHGRYGGAALRPNGTVTAPIYGPTLFQIDDSDGGRLDSNASYDRAVGPMQFLPGTWAGYGADGNGDGRADPQNIDDAALAAGRYLCAGGSDLAHHPGAAVYRYNHSAEYVALVLSLAESYRSGEAPQVQAAGGGPAGARGTGGSDPGHADTRGGSHGSHATHPSGSGKGGGKDHGTGGSGGGKDHGTGNADHPNDPSKPPSGGGGSDGSHSPSGGGSHSPSDSPSSSPTHSSSKPGTPTPSHSETKSPSATPTPTACDSPTPSKSATQPPNHTPTATGKHTSSPTPTTCPTDEGNRK